MKNRLIISIACLSTFVTTTAFCMDEEKSALSTLPRQEQIKLLGRLDIKEILSLNFLMELTLLDNTSSVTKNRNSNSYIYTKDLAAKAAVSFYCGDGGTEHFLGKLSIEVPNGTFEKTITQKYTFVLPQEGKKFDIHKIKFWLIKHTQKGDCKFTSCENKEHVNKKTVYNDQEIKITAIEKRYDDYEIFFPVFLE